MAAFAGERRRPCIVQDQATWLERLNFCIDHFTFIRRFGGQRILDLWGMTQRRASGSMVLAKVLVLVLGDQRHYSHSWQRASTASSVFGLYQIQDSKETSPRPWGRPRWFLLIQRGFLFAPSKDQDQHCCFQSRNRRREKRNARSYRGGETPSDRGSYRRLVKFPTALRVFKGFHRSHHEGSETHGT